MNSAAGSQAGELRAAISSMVVGIYADHVGRGPTKARTYMNDGVVTCLLEDTLTRAERTLLESGSPERVHEIRGNLQEAMRQPLIAKMEALIGRPVAALIWGNHLEPDVSAQVFVLAP